MKKLIFCVSLFVFLPNLIAAAFTHPPFQLIYRQENVANDKWSNTRSDLLITVINLSGGEARDLVVSIPVSNPYLFVDSPVFVPTIPNNRQAEILHKSSMPNELIELSEPENNIIWRIEYTNEAGERTATEIQGVRGQ